MDTALRDAAAEEAGRYSQVTTQIADLQRAGKPVAAFGDPRNPAMFGSRFGPRCAALPPGILAATAIAERPASVLFQGLDRRARNDRRGIGDRERRVYGHRRRIEL